MAKSNIRNFSDAYLLAEIERRKLEANKPPEPLAKPDFSDIIKLANEMVKQKVDGREDDDNDHWCFEAVMDAVYGKGIWDWWNAKK